MIGFREVTVKTVLDDGTVLEHYKQKALVISLRFCYGDKKNLLNVTEGVIKK